MYNHYVRDRDGNYVKVSVEEPPVSYIPTQFPPPKPPQSSPPKQEPAEPPTQTPPAPPQQKSPLYRRPPESQLANKLLGHLNLSDIDSGDLLLLALLFFLFRQNADEELLIALGLLLVM